MEDLSVHLSAKVVQDTICLDIGKNATRIMVSDDWSVLDDTCASELAIKIFQNTLSTCMCMKKQVFLNSSVLY